jgi:hypothetical protein
MSRFHRLRLLGFGVLLIVFVSSGYAVWRKRPSVILSHATRVEVFRLDPSDGRKPGEGRIGGWLITSQGEDQGPEFASDLSEILADDKTYTNNWAKCYDPGIAFRSWRDNDCVDVIICFRCGNLYYGRPTELAKENACFMSSPRASDLVQLAKRAFPHDQKIQALKEPGHR